MKAVVTRVLSASVTIDGNIYSEINRGYLILLGVAPEDTEKDAEYLASKICKTRVFEDENGKMNLSLDQVGGEILVVSQFTLYADCRKGNRPNFLMAKGPAEAERLYEYFTELCRGEIPVVEQGIFGADMKVELLNDGPFTIVLE